MWFFNAFFIFVILFRAFLLRKKNKSNAFFGVEIIFVMLILFGMLIVQKTSLNFEHIMNSTNSYLLNGIESSDKTSNSKDNDTSESELINNLITMQANTLSVTVTIVTISCIIISILTIYRERKTEINSRKVDESLKVLEDTESIVQEIAAISSVLLLNEKQKDFFLSIVKDEIENLSKTKGYSDIAYAHFQMILLNIVLCEQYYMPKNKTDFQKYDLIIRSANKIIENEKATTLSLSFAYVERAHAAFQKLKASTDTDEIAEIQENIKMANKFLFDLDDIKDKYGHICNLKGLVALWTGIAKVRIYDMNVTDFKRFSSDSYKDFTKALDYFEEALNLNPQKIEFKNHKIVALLRLSDVSIPLAERVSYLVFCQT